jgi:hypothetical protein
MKKGYFVLKYILITFLILQTNFLLIKGQYQQVYDILTPNTSTVSDTYEYTGNEPTYSEAEVENMRQNLWNNYGHAELLAIPSPSYNCHAYAWHVSEGGRLVWIGKYTIIAEDIYWDDYSYYEVTSESNATKVSYPELGNHSAITTEQNEWYISKWGSNVLARHKWDEVPSIYFPDDPDYDLLTFYAPSNPSDTKYIEDFTFKAGVYINGNKIKAKDIIIDIDNIGWVTFEASNYVLIEKNFEVTLGSTFEIK